MNTYFNKTRAFRSLVLIASVFSVVIPVAAKRAVPKKVPALVVDGIEYSAPREHMGFVVATDASNHQELWRKRIYNVWLNPFLERDVQDVFISAMALERGILVITNERGETYTLDLVTRKVARRP